MPSLAACLYDTMGAFYEYISPKFSIICLIKKENEYSYNTVLRISSKSLYWENLTRLEKMKMIFDSVLKNAFKSAIIHSTLKTSPDSGIVTCSILPLWHTVCKIVIIKYKRYWVAFIEV